MVLLYILHFLRTVEVGSILLLDITANMEFLLNRERNLFIKALSINVPPLLYAICNTDKLYHFKKDKSTKAITIVYLFIVPVLIKSTCTQISNRYACIFCSLDV